ncbi:MAG: efflux RND transporter periplasmic adaptor subunit, partial [Pseudomonadota bacterium]
MVLDFLLFAVLVAGAVVGIYRGAGRIWPWALLAALGAFVTLGVWWLVPSGTPSLTRALAASFSGVFAFALGLIAARWFVQSARPVRTPRSRLAGAGLGSVLGVSLFFIALPAVAVSQPSAIASSLTAVAYRPLLPSSASPPADKAVAKSTPRAAAKDQRSQAEAEASARRLIAWTRVATINGKRSQSYTGTVRATDRAQLAFEVTGDIAAILVKVGDTVKAGDVLARLDETPLRLAVAERDARVAEARAVLEEARADFRRQRSLFRRKVIAEARLERAQLSLSTAASRLKSAEAARKTAEDSLASTILRAPFDARVSAQLREASEIAMAGSPVLELEGLTSGRELIVNLPEEVVSRIGIGDAFPLNNREGMATVTEIGSRARGGATFPVTLALQTKTPVLTGATRSVQVQYQAHVRTVMTVPLGAVAVGTE